MFMAVVWKGSEILYIGLRAVDNRRVKLLSSPVVTNMLFLDCLWFSICIIIVSTTNVGFVPFQSLSLYFLILLSGYSLQL